MKKASRVSGNSPGCRVVCKALSALLETFTDGKAQRIAITPNRGGRLRLTNPFPVCEVRSETGSLRVLDARLLELDTQPGQRLEFTAKNNP